MQEHIPTVVCL
jgi:hypothetical protein